jgi:hypothetical protein
VRSLDEVVGQRGGHAAVVLDEFQEVDGLLERGAWVIRDLMQTTPHLSWVCAGSRLSLIDELIAPRGPFFRYFESVSVGPMDAAHLARWIESRMEGAGVAVEEGLGARVVDLTGPRTQDCLQLARAVHAAGQASGRARRAEVAAALRRTVLEDGDRFETVWAGLADSHRGILRALAAGEEQLGAQTTRRTYALPTTASISKAVRVLRERRHLSASGPPRIDDPFFREWILLRAMPDGLPHEAAATVSPD